MGKAALCSAIRTELWRADAVCAKLRQSATAGRVVPVKWWEAGLQPTLKDEQVMVTRAKTHTRPAPLTATPANDAYIPGDALPVPEVIEKDSDSVWAMWSDAIEGRTRHDAETQPATLLMALQDLPKEDDHR